MISYQDILKDPIKADIPVKNEVKWSTVLHVLNHVTQENFEGFTKYIERYPVDYKIIFYRAIKIKYPQLTTHPSFIAAMVSLASMFE